MNEWTSRFPDTIDSHVHMGDIEQEAELEQIRQAIGVDRIGLVAIQNPAAGSGLPQALYMKARQPRRYYVFAGLNHAAQLSAGQVQTAPLEQQVERFVDMGCDGIKMIEGKPTSRQRMDIPVDDPYFAAFWRTVEALDLPIVWHVNDPEEFWDPATTPVWALERNWGYGPEDVTKEQLYAEVDAVLQRHQDLRIVFAHFYFLSADLPRAQRFLDAHPRVAFDLTPGIEMLYNLSRDVEATRDFFLRYADRILFGTDIFSDLSVREGQYRAGIVYRWLESDDMFRVPAGADFLLGQPADGEIHGLALPDEVLTRIYRSNFTARAGDEPRPLNVDAAIEECRRLAEIAAGLSATPAGQTLAARVATSLAE